MSRTYRDFRRAHRHMLRKPKGHTNALRNNARHGAVPPDPWNDIVFSSEHYVPYRIAERLLKQGKTVDEVATKLSRKYNLPKLDMINFVNDVRRWI